VTSGKPIILARKHHYAMKNSTQAFMRFDQRRGFLIFFMRRQKSAFGSNFRMPLMSLRGKNYRNILQLLPGPERPKRGGTAIVETIENSIPARGL
jgi:hypothetical protein